MKKIITILLVMSNFVLGQNGFYQLDFETPGGYSTSITEASDGLYNFFTRTNGLDIGPNYSLNGKVGSYYFAAQDINDVSDPAPTLPLEFIITNVNISSHTGLVFSILLAEDDDGSNQDWDNADYVHIFYNIDASGWNELLWIENDGTGSNSAPYIDTDFNYIGDGSEITNTFTEFTTSILGNGNSIDIKIEFNLNSGDEDIALDNIRIGSDQIPLPVELTTFSASIFEESVELIWETVTEINNYGFEIERKIKEGEWNKLDFVNGHGNSNSPKYYSFLDNSIEGSGNYYYRLKQIDIDGTYEYSEIVEANLGVPNKFELNQNFPNPFNPTTSIQFNLPQESDAKLSVFNVLGEEVVELINNKISAGYHSIQFDGAELNSGIYFYKLESKDFTQIRKMMLIK